MRADLHMHSNVSDGSDSILSLIEQARSRQLDAIAITDHDTMSHLNQIPVCEDIMVLGGVELSAMHKESSTRAHILGYHIKTPETITAFTQPLLEARSRNSEKQVSCLIEAGFHMEMDQLGRADGTYLYKQHIMDWLVSTGQAPELFGEFYHNTFKNGGICAFDIEYLDAFEAVRRIKEAGGLAVLAHPGQQQNFWLIPELVKEGLDGLELNHHTHSEDDRKIIREYQMKYGLFLTGGSDYHGRYEPQTFGVGDFLSDESGVNAICRK